MAGLLIGYMEILPLNNLPPKSAFFTLVICSLKEELTSCVCPHTYLVKPKIIHACLLS
jgi:hypothetical protein